MELRFSRRCGNESTRATTRAMSTATENDVESTKTANSRKVTLRSMTGTTPVIRTNKTIMI